jgi:hypothetical protein
MQYENYNYYLPITTVAEVVKVLQYPSVPSPIGYMLTSFNFFIYLYCIGVYAISTSRMISKLLGILNSDQLFLSLTGSPCSLEGT